MDPICGGADLWEDKMNDSIRSPMTIIDLDRAVFDGGSILLVDDQTSLLHVLSRMLSISGFEVQTAGSGEEALHLFSRGSFALVLTDFNMPGMDGLTLAHKIKNDSPDTPVIMMTGADDQKLKKLKESGCVECILKKPFRWEQLHEIVSKALMLRSRFFDRDKTSNANAIDFKEQSCGRPGNSDRVCASERLMVS